VLKRAEFSSTDADGAIADFVAPVDEDGAPVVGRWRIEGARLRHEPDSQLSDVPYSFLLSTVNDAEQVITESFAISLWTRVAVAPGYFDLVGATEREHVVGVARFVRVRMYLATQKVALIEKSDADQAPNVIAEVPFSIPADRWFRLFVRFVEVQN